MPKALKPPTVPDLFSALKAAAQLDPWVAEYTRHALRKAADVIALGATEAMNDPVLRYMLDMSQQWWDEFTAEWERLAPQHAESEERQKAPKYVRQAKATRS